MRRGLNSRLRRLLTKEKRRKYVSAVGDLGCTNEFLIKYLESKFTLGMSWDMYRAGKIHIDHIKPLAKFDLTSPEEQKQACHYTNLQPLWASDNFRKKDNF